MNKENIFEKLITSTKFRILSDFELPNWSKQSHVDALVQTMRYYKISEAIIQDGIANLMEANDTGISDKARSFIDAKKLKHITRGYYSKSGKSPAEFKREGDSFKAVSGDDAKVDSNTKKKPDTKKASNDDSKTASDTSGEAEEPEIIPIDNGPLSPEVAKKRAEVGSVAAKLKVKKIEDELNAEAEQNKPDVPDVITVAGKNKALSTDNPLESDTYTKPARPAKNEYYDKIKKNNIILPASKPYEVPSDIINSIKIPSSMIDILERMVNTKASTTTAKYSYFSESPGGAGRIPAQAGEIMALIGSTLSDVDADRFYDSLEKWEASFIAGERKKVRDGGQSEFVKKDKSGSLLRSDKHFVDNSWIAAARKNRSAIMKRLRKEYGPDVVVTAGAWDTKEQAHALGMSNYDDNKGFSTDVFLRIQLPDGREVLDEISLKKSTLVNFLNSGVGKFSEWDSNLPDNISQSVYASKQRDQLGRFGLRNIDAIKEQLNKPNSKLKNTIINKLGKLKDESVQEMIKNEDFVGLVEMSYNDTLSGAGSRGKSKVLRDAIWILAADGNQDAIAAKRELEQQQSDFQSNAVNAIIKNDKLKNGMLDDIKSEFPLKAVSDGEETMAIGEYSLDRLIMDEIFGTSNFDDIKEQLDSEPGPPPFLGYRVEATGKIIPIAKIDIREDGVGYGGSIKFDMRLHPGFAKALSAANKKIYGS